MPEERESPKTPPEVSDSGDSQSAVEKRLDKIVEILARAHPVSRPRWYERLYAGMQTFAKYVGIPALVLASISPVITAFDGYREYRNKKYLNATYAGYAEDLLARGAVERARGIMTELENAEKRDVRAQYMFAKVATMEAIKRGRNYQEAEDRANILLRLHQNRDWLFPSFGGGHEVADLQLALVDIHLQLGRYADAEKLLQALRRPPVAKSTNKEAFDRLLNAEVQLRVGTMAVLKYQYANAIQVLTPAAATFVELARPDLTADAEFQLAKAHQFAYHPAEALAHYGNAQKNYALRHDDWGLLKVYNNTGMINLDRHDLQQAAYYFGQAEKVARAVNDQLGIARAVSNLSIIEKERGRYPEAEKKALEALEAFRLADNKLGMAAAYQSLGNLAFMRGDAAAAIHNSEQAATIFRAEHELRGLSDALGLMSQAVESLGDNDQQVFYNAYAYFLRRHIGKPEAAFNLGRLTTLGHQMPHPLFERSWFVAVQRIRSELREMNALEVLVDAPSEVAMLLNRKAA